MVSSKLRREVLLLRSRGVRQYELARRARLHPTVLSALLNGAIPVRHADERVVRVGQVVGVPAVECFDDAEILTAPGPPAPRALPAHHQSLTFAALAQREPRLQQLYDEAAAVRDDGRTRSFCATVAWYGYGCPPGSPLRDRVKQLVGWWNTDDPVLGTDEASRLAYDTIYTLLPGCRNCCCIPVPPDLGS